MDEEEIIAGIEILIILWLKSNDENATNLAHSIYKYLEREALNMYVVGCSFCSDCGDKVPKGDNMCDTCYKSM